MTHRHPAHQVLKMYAWEPSFRESVKEIRNSELSYVKKQAYASAAIDVTWLCAPYLVSHLPIYFLLRQQQQHLCLVALSFMSFVIVDVVISGIMHGISRSSSCHHLHHYYRDSHYHHHRYRFHHHRRCLRHHQQQLHHLHNHHHHHHHHHHHSSVTFSIPVHHRFLQVTLAVFTTYVLSSPDNYLTPQVAFVSLSLIQMLNFGVSFLPLFITFAAQV